MYNPLIKLASASLLSQAVALAVMPFITRLHTPDTLGVYQFFTTVALVFTPFISGSLAVAIKSAPSSHGALAVLRLAVHFSFFGLVFLLLIYPLLSVILSASSLSWFASYLPLLIVFVFLSANFQFAMAYLTSSRRYGKQSSYTVTKSIMSNGLKLLFSLISVSGTSLVLALIVTEILQIGRVIKSGKLKFIKSLFQFDLCRFGVQLRSAKTYPTYVTLTSVIGILMNWFPILITGALYGPEFAGFLGLAFMVVNTPVYPFIEALRTVCFGELAKGGDIGKYMSIYMKSMLIASGASALGLVILGFYGSELFALIFGEQWRAAGLYAFICFIPISLSFVLSPVYSTLNHFFGFQKLYFWMKVSFLIVGVLVTSYLGFYGYDFLVFLTAFAVLMSFNHLFLFFVSIFVARHISSATA